MHLYTNSKQYTICSDIVAPGPIENTPGTAKLAPGFTAEDMKDMMMEGIPMGRLGTNGG